MNTYKRCKCRDADGRELGKQCPKLRRANGSYNPNHGSWYFQVEAEPDENGKRRTVRRGGFPTQAAAEAAGEEARGRAKAGADITRKLTVGQYLREWLDGLAVRGSTMRSYRQHVEGLWTPQCGRVELSALRRHHVAEALATLSCGSSTAARYRATLRNALNDAKREGLVTVNVAELVKMTNTASPKARVWTDSRVVAWQAEYELRRQGVPAGSERDFMIWHEVAARPSPVMVWTPAQVGRFLDAAADHRWYALFHVIAFRGLRRGEACGLRREDLDLEVGTAAIRWQLTESGAEVTEGPVKTDASDATVTLDVGTVAVLREHLAAQAEQRQHWGSAWVQTAYVFTNEDGSRVRPSAVSAAFEALAFEAGLPPVRLHDLRHGAASIMRAAGLDMKLISATLRHSTSKITSDLYTSIFEDHDRAAAEAAAAVVPRARRAPEGSREVAA